MYVYLYVDYICTVRMYVCVYVCMCVCMNMYEYASQLAVIVNENL
jgi:hypothetical protein